MVWIKNTAFNSNIQEYNFNDATLRPFCIWHDNDVEERYRVFYCIP